MKKEDIEKLKIQILKTGFPTELEVGRIFLQQNWSVDFNSFYIDKDEEKGREIDLICSYFVQEFNEKIESAYEISFYFITEVKTEKTKPWVIFMSESSSIEQIFNLPNKWVNNRFNHSLLNTTFKKYNEKLHSKIGRSAIEGFSSGKDKIFGSFCNTTKALEHSIESSFINNDKSPDSLFAYYEPLIVLDGELISATLNEKNNLELKEENYIQVKFNYLSPNYQKTRSDRNIIHLVKKSFLADFIKLRKQQFESIATEIIKVHNSKINKLS